MFTHSRIAPRLIDRPQSAQAGGESGEVVEEDVIRGVTYMWKQLKQATKSTPKKDRRISFTSRKSVGATTLVQLVSAVH